MQDRFPLLLPLMLCAASLRAITTPEMVAPRPVAGLRALPGRRPVLLALLHAARLLGTHVGEGQPFSSGSGGLGLQQHRAKSVDGDRYSARRYPALPKAVATLIRARPASTARSALRMPTPSFPAGDELAKFFTQFGYICSPSSQPFQPYFLSQLDTLAWRSSVPEMTWPEALTPGMREVGQNGDMWGNIYPRAGAISQTHRP